MYGFIAQLVEHRTGIAKVMGSNPVEALIFFRLLLSSCLNWKIYCDDHTSLSKKKELVIYLDSVSKPKFLYLGMGLHCKSVRLHSLHYSFGLHIVVGDWYKFEIDSEFHLHT